MASAAEEVNVSAPDGVYERGARHRTDTGAPGGVERRSPESIRRRAAAKADATWSDEVAHRLAEPGPGSLVDAFGVGPAQALGSTGSERSGVRSTLRVAAFRRLWIALAFSSLGDWLGLLATTGMAVQLGGQTSGQRGAAFALGGVLLVRLFPSLFLGPFAGAVADRFDRRLVMITSDIMRAGFFISIALVNSLVWLTVATFLSECVGLFWIPAKEASVPNLLEPEQIEPANQLSLITTYGSAPVAALLYAVLASVSRGLGSYSSFFAHRMSALALFVDAASFAYGAFVVLRLTGLGGRRRSTQRATDGKREKATDVARGLLADTLEGIRFVGSTKLVRGILVGIVGGFAAVGTVAACGRLYAGDLGGGDAAYGLLFGGVFTGLAMGMALGPKLTRRILPNRVFGLAISGAGFALAVTSVLPNVVLALLGVTFVGFLAGLAWVTGQTLLGREVDDLVRGRTFAIVQSSVRVTLFAVLGVAPFIVGLIGPHSVHLGNHTNVRADGATIVMLVGGLIGGVVGILSFRQMDDRAEVSVISELIGAVRSRTPALTHSGVFLVVEGGEGSGKSTQVRLLADWLRASGREVLETREPGATPLGAKLRALLLDADGVIDPRAELFLYGADRAQHVADRLLPALKRGAVVVSDRYVDSTLAYQGAGRALPDDEVLRLTELATGGLRPDAVILLDVDAETGLARARSRGAGVDRLEAENLAFHQRVRRRFLEIAEADRDRYVVVETDPLDLEQVHERVRKGVLRVLGEARLWPSGTERHEPAPVEAAIARAESGGQPETDAIPVA